MYDEAKKVNEWTGGGLHARTHPATNQLTRCTIVVHAAPDGFEVPDDFEPNDGLFECSEDNVVGVDGDYGEGVTLESLGLSEDDLQ